MMPIIAVCVIFSMVARRLVTFMFTGEPFYGGQVQAKGSEKQLSRSFSNSRAWGVERTALMCLVSFDVDIV